MQTFDILIIAGAILASPVVRVVAEAAMQYLFATRPELKAGALELAHTIEKAAGGDGQ
jgi:hypothetical protein